MYYRYGCLAAGNATRQNIFVVLLLLLLLRIVYDLIVGIGKIYNKQCPAAGPENTSDVIEGGFSFELLLYMLGYC